MDKGTKIYIVWIVILLFLFIAVIFWCIGNLGANGNSSISNNQPTTISKNIYSSNINSVRLATLHEYPTLKIRDLLENYQYFKSFKWKEFTTKQGEHIISFTADYYAEYFPDTTYSWAHQTYDYTVEYKTYKTKFEIQFAVYTNGSGFKIKQFVLTDYNEKIVTKYFWNNGYRSRENNVNNKTKSRITYDANSDVGGLFNYKTAQQSFLDAIYDNRPLYFRVW